MVCRCGGAILHNFSSAIFGSEIIWADEDLTFNDYWFNLILLLLNDISNKSIQSCTIQDLAICARYVHSTATSIEQRVYVCLTSSKRKR
ncbi:unnamed protein product [Cylicocyclus nassatus]|uniref:Uncharacterized protein n=1 Tax=Cylicocyclus nassatus TaxID=53992 RepID=A0AA36M3K9_CYLNA|nr:unnamed protein product [Cylicocyclus nassatus]